MKKCTKCKKVKDTKEFFTNLSRIDRLTNRCKICQEEYEISRRQSLGPATTQSKIEATRLKALTRKTVRREQVMAARSNRRVRKNGAAGYASAEQIAARRDYYGGRCYICGEEAAAMDHVIPVAKSGSNWPANLRPICKRCNSTKSAKWPYDIQAARQACFEHGEHGR